MFSPRMFAGALALALPLAAQTPRAPTFRMAVDSAHREVVLTLGPYHVESDSGMEMSMAEMGDIMSPLFVWPTDALVQGYELRLMDSTGHTLSRRLLHHYGVIDFDRRELAYPVVLHLFGGGAETGDVMLPGTVGVPFVGGDHMAFYLMWHNESGQDVDGVYLQARIRWIPRNQQPAAVAAMPFWVDVNFHPGGAPDFDDPPGGCTRTYAFTVAVSGRLLGMGGHLHEWGSSVRLEDAETGDVIARMVARRDSTGEVLSISRKIFGMFGTEPHLDAGRRYLMVVTYENPTQDTVRGVMGFMGGLFVPDRRQWPVIDRTNADYLADLRGWVRGIPKVEVASGRP